MSALPGYATTYTVVKEGSGATVVKGNTVTVHATGTVKETGKKFWYVDAKPFLHCVCDSFTRVS
jgi:hypothetical protein